ncbi:DEAD/DEAH box helicase [uncultured Methanobrevibacter sp.]|uniref:DEAD/DEAH box helicase n=1 Tax=uncultured Methanobrevibacter sp. TaxID=253161 RepID=UPI002616BB00|nr:DEAD/DEAH box helicase [uncultured Methanobrevibacter sp.]
MANESAELLNFRLRRFLVNVLGWKKLNEIQDKAIPVILDGNDSLVIAPTASGKTEAVLLPVFSEIISNGFDPTSVIYVAPLKALINDMHNRIEYWGDYFNLSATKWHGDVSAGVKSKYLNNPTDFLLITPESLEVLSMNKSQGQKFKIFQNVRYIIIDEIHYFADSERGTQLNSLINRLSKYSKHDIQQIGLSATVGNPETIAEWINYKEPAIPIIDTSNRESKYKVDSLSGINLVRRLEVFKNKKVLVFCKSRQTTEEVFNLFKNNSSIKNIFIHHSSLNKDVREESERQFKSVKSGFMFSTSTLELGIDIGDIDVVVHIEPPYNISSFLQRVGRSGRRSKVQKSIIIAHGFDTLVALADLILQENKVEDIVISKRSKDILFHQILSTIFNHGKIHFKDVYNDLRNCYAFSEITKDDYKALLRKMVKENLVKIDGGGYLTTGYCFEKIFGKNNYMNFYSVFYPSFEYSIKKGRKTIGGLDISYVHMLDEGSQFILAGKPWKVKTIDEEGFFIRVEEDPNPDLKAPRWFSEGPPLTYDIARKVYDILVGNLDSEEEASANEFLDNFGDLSTEYIDTVISLAKKCGFRKGIIPVDISRRDNMVTIYTFAGNKANNLLPKIFELKGYGLSRVYNNEYFSSFKLDEEISVYEISNVLGDVEEIFADDDYIEDFIDILQEVFKNKFIDYLPEKDVVELKMDLQYDKDGLINVVNENEFVETKSDVFKEVLFNSRDLTDEEILERLHSIDKKVRTD